MPEIDLTRYQAPALNRGIDVMETLAAHADGLAPSEISRLLSLSTSQLFRILATLELRGYVSRVNGGERYVVTLRLFTVAHRQSKLARLLAVAEPVMRGTARQVQQAILLSVRNGPQMVVISFVPAPAVVSIMVPVGQEYSLVNSTAGLLHLSREEPGTRAALVAEIESIDKNRLDRNRLKMIPRLAGEQSLVEPSPDIEGVTNHTTVLSDCDGRPFASLSLPFVKWPQVRLREAEVHDRLMSTAAEIESLLAGRRDGGGFSGVK